MTNHRRLFGNSLPKVSRSQLLMIPAVFAAGVFLISCKITSGGSSEYSKPIPDEVKNDSKKYTIIYSKAKNDLFIADSLENSSYTNFDYLEHPIMALKSSLIKDAKLDSHDKDNEKKSLSGYEFVLAEAIGVGNDWKSGSELLSITLCKDNSQNKTIQNQKNSSDTLINGSTNSEWKEYKMIYARFNQENRVRTFYSEKAYNSCSN